MTLPSSIRKLLFWAHLATGLLAGAVILVLCLTGLVLAFEPQVLAWAEARHNAVSNPGPGAQRLPLETLLQQARALRPRLAPETLLLLRDGELPVTVGFGRQERVRLDPYRGTEVADGAAGWRAFFDYNESLHRWLVLEGPAREWGRGITGISNGAFVLLGISGLYLWWPRGWTRARWRNALWFRRGLRGKARDFSWHNVIGAWCLPVLLIVSVTGVVISYRWASNLVFLAMGETPPPPRKTGSGGSDATSKPERRSADAVPASVDVVAESVMKTLPDWKQLSVRFEGQGADVRIAGVNVRERDAWPPFATVQVAVNPWTGAMLNQERFAQGTRGRRLRTWFRFLHTGEALGPFGQSLAAVGCLGGMFLVWTGASLSWRRFFGRARQPPRA